MSNAHNNATAIKKTHCNEVGIAIGKRCVLSLSRAGVQYDNQDVETENGKKKGHRKKNLQAAKVPEACLTCLLTPRDGHLLPLVPVSPG